MDAGTVTTFHCRIAVHVYPLSHERIGTWLGFVGKSVLLPRKKHAHQPYHMLRSLLLTLLLGIVFFLAPTLGIADWIHPSAGYMILFFTGISFLIHRLMEYGFSNKRDKFVEFYLSTVVIRLILCVIFVSIFLYLGVENQPIFIANFFALYLFYTIFEIFGLYRNLRRDS